MIFVKPKKAGNYSFGLKGERLPERELSGRYDTSIDRSRETQRQQLAATVCAIALAFNTLLSIVLPFGSPRTDFAARALMNGWSLICSAAGPIVVDADGHRIADDGAGEASVHAPSCLFCLPLADGHAALAAAAGLPAPLRHALALHLKPRAMVVVATSTASPAWPRAPPQLSVG
ncbi:MULTISPECIES: DUF2946 family protein [unclassified Bradyrhizobium]|uniref:DUF2946 family protein n=1 Tax=unclassified Bradyrhizobium TaxID=2631580 RepID=UPI0028EEA673|nr:MULTISPECIES: DUF2946 family protein [unclassified Bradyrhizobium]